MPDYLTPGVYVEEVELGPPPITGVSTSIAGFVGVTQMGPTTGQPTLVTSYADFERTFGGFLPESSDPDDTTTFLAYAVQGFFQNGGQILYVSRVVGAGATPSAITLPDTITDGGSPFFLTRPAQQMPPTKDSIALVSARFVSAGTQITLIEPTDAGEVKETATVHSVDGDTVHLTAATANRFTTNAVVEIPAPAGYTPRGALTLTATSEGTWGQNVRATVTPSSRTSARVLPIDVHTTLDPMTVALVLPSVMPDLTHATLADVSLVRVGDQLRFRDSATPPADPGELATVAAVGASAVELQAPGVTRAYDPASGGTVELAGPPGLRVAADTANVTVAVASAAGLANGQSVQIEDAGGNLTGTIQNVAGADVQLTLDAPFPAARTIPAGATLRLEDAAVGNQLRLAGAANLADGDIVEFTDAAGARSYGTVTGVSGDVVAFADPVPADIAAGATVRTADFDLLVELTRTNATTGAIEVVQQESHTFLTVAAGSPNGAVARINERSSLVRAALPASANDPPQGYPTTVGRGTFTSSVFLADGGAGATPTADDVIADPGAGPGERKGIQSLQDLDEISIIAAPGIADPNVHAALIEQCERLKYRFAVIEAPRASTIPQVEAYRNQFDTRYAAIYYPWLTINDPLTGRPRTAPPSGHVIGVYARVDNTRGVHKAPANEVLGGITGLELTLTNGEQGVLNEPRNINVIRDFRQSQRGIRIWGARCVTSDTDWKYVNVRRLFIYLEHSLDKGTQWVVFEPNDEPLWARARQSRLDVPDARLARRRAAGAKAEQAFFVTCDRTTMTQDDIDNGRLIMVIGIAPVKPAEFVDHPHRPAGRRCGGLRVIGRSAAMPPTGTRNDPYRDLQLPPRDRRDVGRRLPRVQRAQLHDRPRRVPGRDRRSALAAEAARADQVRESRLQARRDAGRARCGPGTGTSSTAPTTGATARSCSRTRSTTTCSAGSSSRAGSRSGRARASTRRPTRSRSRRSRSPSSEWSCSSACRLYAAPGLYVEPPRPLPPPLGPLRTDVAAFVGIAQRGPVGVPVSVSSWQQLTSRVRRVRPRRLPRVLGQGVLRQRRRALRRRPRRGAGGRDCRRPGHPRRGPRRSSPRPPASRRARSPPSRSR